MRLVQKIAGAANTLAKWLCKALMVSLCAVILLQVFYRYVLNAALVWPEELARYLMIWLTFVGASIAVAEGAHVRVEFLVDRLPPRSRRWVEVGARLVVLAFLLMFVSQSYQVAELKALHRSETLGITLFLPALGLVFGGMLMIIQLVNLLLLPGFGSDQGQQPQQAERP